MIGNYREISLGFWCSKGFTRLLAWSLDKFCEEKVFMEAQGGFRSKRCADQLFVIRGL